MSTRVCDKLLRIAFLIARTLSSKYVCLIYKRMRPTDLSIMGCEWKFFGKMCFLKFCWLLSHRSRINFKIVKRCVRIGFLIQKIWVSLYEQLSIMNNKYEKPNAKWVLHRHRNPSYTLILILVWYILCIIKNVKFLAMNIKSTFYNSNPRQYIFYNTPCTMGLYSV